MRTIGAGASSGSASRIRSAGRIAAPAAAPAPYATFVTYDATAYEALRQKVRMAWQMRGPTGPALESRVDAFALMDETPAFAPLPLPRAFAAPWKGTATAPAPVAPLLPPSVADRAALTPVATAPDDAAEARAALRADLLAFPEEEASFKSPTSKFSE